MAPEVQGLLTSLTGVVLGRSGIVSRKSTQQQCKVMFPRALPSNVPFRGCLKHAATAVKSTTAAANAGLERIKSH